MLDAVRLAEARELAARLLAILDADAMPPVPEPAFDAPRFFDAVRAQPFGGRLRKAQVEGLELLLKGLEGWPLSWVAYALGTTFHETARAMQPVRETGRGRGTRYGTLYYGRGYVQLTWRDNYDRAGRELGIDLAGDPDRALEPGVALAVMRQGMEAGWFAGDARGRHTLARHLPDDVATEAAFARARRIINGTDRAALVAGHALAFQAALLGAIANEGGAA